MLPRISLVTPSYNQAAYLPAALHSVLSQNYPNLEYIVLDGGSTDGSAEILRHSADRFAYWTSARDGGQSDALNRGFARATGDIFGWLNSDDVLLPGALEMVGAYFAQHPGCEFLTGDGTFVDPSGTRELYLVRGAAYSFRNLLFYCNDKYLPQPSVFFTRAAWERAGGLDVNLKYAMDLDLWLRMRQHTRLEYLPRRLSLLRMHPEAKGEQLGQPALRAVIAITKRYWHLVSPLDRVRLWFGLHHMLARGYCREGMTHIMAGDSANAWASFQAALRADPRIVLSPLCRPLMARLFLPLSVRRRVLHVP